MNKIKHFLSKKYLILIPVHNDETLIAKNIDKVDNYLKIYFKDIDYKLVIAENGSTDNSKKICLSLEKKYPQISFLYLKEAGRGRAIKHVSKTFTSDYYIYMDVDLSTELNCLRKLISYSEKHELIIGSRYHETSISKRFFYRKILSKSYNAIVNLVFKQNTLDFQCGFKGFNKTVAKQIIPLIKDNHWFFDTELIISSKVKKLNVYEMPIIWNESSNTNVRFFRDIIYYITKIIDFRFNLNVE